MKLENIIENYINGNITTARKAAKRISQTTIYQCLRNDFGYSEVKAHWTALHIKTGEGWQEACDAK